MPQKIKQDLSIGPNLQQLRKKSGYTQEQVAAKLLTMGLPASREIVSQMEAGRYSIRVSILLALKEIYHASYEDFFAGLTLEG